MYSPVGEKIVDLKGVPGAETIKRRAGCAQSGVDRSPFCIVEYEP